MQTTVKNNNIVIKIQNRCYVINITKIVYVSNVYESGNKIYFQIKYNDNTEQEIYFWTVSNITNATIKEAKQFLTDVYLHVLQEIKSISKTKNIFSF